ncbi:MAG: class IV adenylate cyclase [Promethearchaeota archaeon]
MIEVEVKANIAHPNEIIQQLNTQTIFLKEIYQEDIYFNSPDRDFKITDEALRIRISSEGSALTYKGPKIGNFIDKTREEISVKIKDREPIQIILEKLRFQPVAKVSKKRLLFRFDDLSISVDFVKDLGEFIEVEGLVQTQKEIESKRTKILDFLEALNIPLEDCERRSYLELLLNKKMESNDSPYRITKK